MTEPSKWAQDEADKLLDSFSNIFTTQTSRAIPRDVALALDAARRRGIEDCIAVCSARPNVFAGDIRSVLARLATQEPQ